MNTEAISVQAMLQSLLGDEGTQTAHAGQHTVTQTTPKPKKKPQSKSKRKGALSPAGLTIADRLTPDFHSLLPPKPYPVPNPVPKPMASEVHVIELTLNDETSGAIIQLSFPSGQWGRLRTHKQRPSKRWPRPARWDNS